MTFSARALPPRPTWRAAGSRVRELAARRVFWIVLSGACVALFVRRWLQVGEFPTGNDPANWFKVGRGLFGESGRPLYPPLVPAAMWALAWLAGPFAAARIVAGLSIVSVVVATAVVAKSGMPAAAAVATAALVGLSRPISETMAYGGYPQNFALAATIVSLLFASRFLASGDVRTQLFTALALTAVGLTHHAYFAVAIASVGAVAALSVLSGRSWLDFGRSLGLFAAMCFAGATAAPVWLLMRGQGYAPPIGLASGSAGSLLRVAYADGAWLWVGLLTTALLYVVASARNRHAEPAWRSAAALILVGGAGFVLTREPRLVPALTAGTLIAIGLAMSELLGSPWTRGGRLPAAAAGAVLAVVAVVGEAGTGAMFDYYRVVDSDMARTISWVDGHHGPGLVVVQSGHDGWPVGWWYEGLTGADIAVGSDRQWLAFQRELGRAAIADSFFTGMLTGAAAQSLAGQLNVESLVFDKRAWSGWYGWQADPGFHGSITFESGRMAVLSFSSEPSP